VRRTLFVVFLFAISAAAQTVRITGPIDEGRRITLRGTVSPRTRGALDLGPVEPSRKIAPVIVLLKRTPEQRAAIEKLLEEQRDPASPDFHKWLTPEQYANRFGLGDSDMSATRLWLQSHGLHIDHAARGRNWIGFSGTAQQIEAALGTRIHRYRSGTEEHFANSTEISVPQALAPVLGAFIGLNDFRNKPRYTTSPPTEHSLAPDDLATIYDILPLYNKGIDGSGQKIAIIGESDLEPGFTDIRTFRRKFHLPAADPQVVLYGPDPGLNGALVEADLDLEWSGAVARNASLIFVNSSDSFTSAIYAIDQNLAPVISASYGICEQEGFYLADLFQALMQQANSQGITFVAASGDAGPSSCDNFDQSPLATNGMDVLFPASIPEVTAVGGTEFDEGSGNYWNVSNTTNGASAISYIPEMAWNDTAEYGSILATGGGPSILYSKPAWQAGQNVPNDNVRDTPDVAMAASPLHDGFWECSAGFCDAFGGGTSAATPVFAGIVALLNEAAISNGIQSTPGLGNINPDLYRIASSTAKVFHDVTTGNNILPCGAGTPDCTNGKLGYSAGPGYDMTTGLGSVDAANLADAWKASAVPTSLTVQADNAGILMSASVQLNITVSSLAGSAIPSGTVSAILSNTATPESHLPGELPLASATLSAGSASILIYGGELNPGSNTITVTYSGDAQFDGSSSTVTVDVSLPTENSAVVPSAFPFDYELPVPPVGQTPADAEGNQWHFVLRLKESAGVATTVTGLMVNGVDLSSQIARGFGSNLLPAHGTLEGGWGINVPSVPATIPVTFRGQDAGGFQWTTGLQIPLVGGPARFVDVGAVVNGASYQAVAAPGMILSIFGNALSVQPSAQAQSLPLPLSLAGSTAKVNGVPAPLYYASYGQVNIQIPYETAPGDAVLTITGWLGQAFNYSFKVLPAAPGIFFDPTNGAPVPYESGSPGQETALYITGEGLVMPALATGASPAAGTPLDQLPKPKLPVGVTVANAPAKIVFIGITPGIVGATQINYVIPSNVPLGLEPVIVTVGGVPSSPVWITVK
jgi:uncharacterized protein (TIGR03437 family)